ncbi:MAG: AP-1 complex subunit gamma-1 [Amphiamblys sp. WSBS2006]|nr:MAG: AP-1 complex subunit gamma-1 [Amphiamblys sp. WSBS2006]
MKPRFLFGGGLKDMIKKTRGCKTKAEERGVVLKELAKIRTSLKRSTPTADRVSSVEKLLYSHLLGFRTDFAQTACLNMAGSSVYKEKRLGYMAMGMLVDECSEVYPLVVNLLKKDIADESEEVRCLSLLFIGGSTFPELLISVAPDVLRGLSSSSGAVSRGSAVCAARIVRIDPAQCTFFQTACIALLNSRGRESIFDGLVLFLEICSVDKALVEFFRPAMPRLADLLQQTARAGTNDFVMEENLFLQIRLLRALAVFGRGNKQASKEMAEALSVTAMKTTDKTRTGMAVLYEAVTTIMEIDAEYSLRTMAINILGRLLKSPDNMTRYVSLNMFEKAVRVKRNRQISSVQRHRETISACLRDGDSAIRKKAAGILLLLSDEKNISAVFEEMFLFLEGECIGEIRREYGRQLFDAVRAHQTDRRAFVECVLRLLRCCDEELGEECVRVFCLSVNGDEQLLRVAACRFYQELTGAENDVFVIASLWFIGEQGDVVFGLAEMGETKIEPVGFLRDVVSGRPARVASYFVTSLSKLYCRVSKSGHDVMDTLRGYTEHEDIEVQQKAVAYVVLLEDAVGATIWAEMASGNISEATQAEAGDAFDT